MMRAFNSRRRWIMAAIILLAGGVVFEKWHRAGTLAPHPFPPTLLPDAPAEARTEFVMTNENFADHVDLWLNPGVPTYDTDISYANYVFQSNIRPVDFARVATRVTALNDPASFLTLVHKDIVYSLFSIGSFKATFNMTPTKAKPEDLFPTQLKPGLGGSFDF